MRIYISGPVTGVEGYEEHFAKAEEYIRKQGNLPFNPVRILKNMPESTTWEEYMNLAICLLEMCDAIFMLQGWQESRGSGIEFEYAYEHKLTIFFEKGKLV